MTINLDVGAGLLKAIVVVVAWLLIRSWFVFKSGGGKGKFLG